MRSRLGCSLAAAVAIVMGGAGGACGKAPAPGEDVTSTTLPPITICFEPDGAPCPPLDAGDDGSEEAGADVSALDASDAGPG